ncbi:MAG: histidine phosphatase family protein [Bacteroidetes bacterium]|nr:histidine phosphatase family protein [Bacteroidota bacterium]HET6242946.1 histidine phosphatase family protein [Bacteroidia bacterium]
MKKLFLVRHAKSSWEDFSINDKDRPLKASGVQDAYLMSAFLQSINVSPELIITSPAARTLSTAIIFSQGLLVPLENIKMFSNLYESSPQKILDVILMTDNALSSLMVFGHDPSLTALYTILTGINIEKIPTSAVASISLNINHWKDLAQGTGILEFFHKPKEVKSISN